ncbi:MAG: PAS domain S-box protein [Geobacter sp.]|nr:PAS domain S-box protein [Geobacter sp.]
MTMVKQRKQRIRAKAERGPAVENPESVEEGGSKEHEALNVLFRMVEAAKDEWERTVDSMEDMIILADSAGRIRRCNESFRRFTGRPYQEMIGKSWKQLLKKQGMNGPALFWAGVELRHEASHRWFLFDEYPCTARDGFESSGVVITMRDITDLKNASKALSDAYDELKSTHAKLLQQEKMASIGQLAAGVAHEINNPIGYVSSNLRTMEKYVKRLSEYIYRQDDALGSQPNGAPAYEELQVLRRRLKIDFIADDVVDLLKESLEGTERVQQIVRDLKCFSHVDEAEWKLADINECLESTLNVVGNELKYKAAVKKDFGELPRVKCYPQRLNQVFMNLLVNAVHSIDNFGEISVRTWQEGKYACISVADTGGGIPPELLNRVFEPFFTTKEVGRGTGLGLSISYDIVKKHGGEIFVASEVGKGTTFVVKIPLSVEGGHHGAANQDSVR